VISVVQLGTTSYAEGLRLQQKLVGLRKAGTTPDVLLLLDHSPVITLGRNAKAVNVLASAEALAAWGVEVFECDRGGDVTFHGPGQIVGYPIFDLQGFSRQPSAVSHQLNQPQLSAESLPPWRKSLGVVDYVRRLEEVLIRTCADFGIPTKRVAGLTGVWTDGGSREESGGPSTSFGDSLRESPNSAQDDIPGVEQGKSEAKIAAIGVHISRAVTSHGFALNVNTDLSYFGLIVPCGITAKPVTSMEKELGRAVDSGKVAESISRNFGVVFGRQMLWVETIDALMGNQVGVPLTAPEELRCIHNEEDTTCA